MPVPFFVDRQDVDAKWKVQNAFAVLYYLRDEVVSAKIDDVTYTVKFFDGATMKDSDGEEIQLGYFNPTLPKGMASNFLELNYGDKCEKTNDYREAEVQLSCGSELAITGVNEFAPCRFRLQMNVPNLCSAKDYYDYLDQTDVEANDGGWWNYKVNFFKYNSVGSSIFMFHSEGAHSDRIKLGEIDNTLNGDADMTFGNGDLCDSTKLPRSGTIHMECGCQYEIKEMTEPTVCKYEVVITHPDACEEAPTNCASEASNLKAELIERKRNAKGMMTGTPTDWDEIYSTRMDSKKFPRDLLNVHYTNTDSKYWAK